MSTALTDDPGTTQGNQPPAGQQPAGDLNVNQPQEQQPAEVMVPQFGVGEDGRLSEGWYKSNLIPEELRDFAPFQRIETVQGLATTTASALRKMGVPPEELVRVGEHASAEDKARLSKALGVPETPEGYADALKDWEAPKGLGEGFAPDPEFLKRAHEQGITGKQLQWLYSEYGQERDNMSAQVQQSIDKQIIDAEKALLDDETFGKQNFDESMKFAKAGFREALIATGVEPGGEEAMGLEKNLQANPMLMKVLAHFGRNFTEGKVVTGEPAPANVGKSLEQEQKELMSEFFQLKEGDPRRAEINKRLDAISLQKVRQAARPQG